jgi:ADP-heptose:LPS heptosyltransferase
MHLAVAVGVACVVLHGTTRPEISGPYGSAHVAVQAYYQHGTARHRRRAANEAMMAITVEEVCAACDRVLTSPERVAAHTRAA